MYNLSNITIKEISTVNDIHNNQLTISSREIAKLCNKEHKNVLRVCRELKDKSISAQIEPIKYIDSKGREYQEFLLNKRDSLVLVARLSPEFTAKVVDRWQELENNQHKLPNNYIEALESLIAKEKENKALEQQIEQDKPKVIFANSVEASKTSILIGDLAKILKQNNIDIGQNRLFDWLRDNKYLYKNKNMPTQKAMDLKLFEIKETTINKPSGESVIRLTPRITGKGQAYFINKFLNSQLTIN